MHAYVHTHVHTHTYTNIYINIFLALFTERGERCNSSNNQNSQHPDLTSKCHSPLKGNRATWRNGWFHDMLGKYIMSLEYLVEMERIKEFVKMTQKLNCGGFWVNKPVTIWVLKNKCWKQQISSQWKPWAILAWMIWPIHSLGHSLWFKD